MINLRFNVSSFQTSIFHWSNGKDFVIVGLYVDDILIIGNNDGKINNPKQKLSKTFEMMDSKIPEIFRY